MTFAEIKALHEMGFTPDQIIQITNSASFPSGADAPAVQANPGPDAESSPAVDGPEDNNSVNGEALPSASPITDETGDNGPGLDALAAIREDINSLRAMIQTNNIRDRTFTPAPVPEVPEVAAEDILALLIRPELKGDK